MKRLLPLVLAALLVLAGCGNNKDPLQVAQHATAAKPASVPMTKPPAGQHLDTGGPVLDTAVTGGTLFVAQPNRLRLYATANPRHAPRTVPLPGKPGLLSTAGQAVLVPIPSRHVLLTVHGDGSSTRVPLPGPVTSAVRAPDGALVAAIASANRVVVLRGGHVVETITGNVHPGQLCVAGGTVFALDPQRTALFPVDRAGHSFGSGIRAGQGASRAVADKYGRVLVTDARMNQLLAFSTGPLLLRQREPVGKTPFGLAYDSVHDRIWVTLTGVNEVAEYAVGHGEPELLHRYATVGSPDSVAVEPRSGTAFVGSAAQDGLAVVHP